jgi:putative oxidoreductase
MGQGAFFMLRSIYHGIQTTGKCLQTPLLLIIRLYWGYEFAATGFGKLAALDQITVYFQSLGIPFPYFNALLTGCVELVCGALLVLGLFTRVAAIPLIVVTTVAYLTAESVPLMTLIHQRDPSAFFAATPFLFLYASVILFCFGPGKASCDYFIEK